MSYNVNRAVTDPFYRYKMPKLVAKVEGKGNGIKTVIVNMVDIGKALGCPPTYPCKFFGCELGAQTQFNFKDERYIVNGSHESVKLQQQLDVFIKKFILCKECDNPETVMHPNEKKGMIRQTCKACGHQSQLDMRHKLTTFILKNPPDVKIDQLGSSKTQKKDRSKTQQNEQANGEDADQNGGLSDSDWDDVDTSEAAVQERMAELGAGVKHLTLSAQAGKTQAEKLEYFYEYCKGKIAAGALVAGCDVEVFKDISAEADTLELKDTKAVMALAELLFTGDIMAQVKAFHKLLLLFTYENSKSQRYLLGAVEKIIELNRDALLPKTAHVMKLLYDTDVVDEEVFLDWGKKPSKKYVSKELSTEIQEKAKVFIEWLKNAAEESSEEESEESDVEIEYDEKARPVALKDQEKPKKEEVVVVAEAVGDEEGDDSDVDIDNI